MWVVTSNAGADLRLLDFERRRVMWQDHHHGNGMPMFSRDGRFVSIPFKTSREASVLSEAGRRAPDDVWVYDVATGKRRVAVWFAKPFQIILRSSWVDNDRAFVVNRVQTIAHIVMLDKFGTAVAQR